MSVKINNYYSHDGNRTNIKSHFRKLSSNYLSIYTISYKGIVYIITVDLLINKQSTYLIILTANEKR